MREQPFTPSDLQQFTSRGLTESQIRSQLETLKNGIPHVKIRRPCTIGDGIIAIAPSDIDALTLKYTKAASAGRIMKFVPASGTASRMFQDLVDTNDNDALQSLKHLYAHQPKALIPFHHYTDHSRPPLDEHLVEAAEYTRDTRNIASIHFTVSPDHENLISSYVTGVTSRYEQNGVTFDVSYSHQKPSTDTIATDENDQPFRDASGTLVLRQAGHGALLENLSDLKADVVFIKNIDNVVPDRLKAETYRYKKILGGLLVSIQEELFGFLEHLTAGLMEESALARMVEWGEQIFSLTMPVGFAPLPMRERVKFLHRLFNRPIRVCGMVRTTKESGGRPFWVQHDDGAQSLQIVEMTQIDTNSEDQRAVLAASTHFNPVDIVCGLRDYHGDSFDLRTFVDLNAGIITTKSHEGRTLRALEYPGLWNGSMAYWNTIFVEVPAITFNPVKTVLDLLRPEHQ